MKLHHPTLDHEDVAPPDPVTRLPCGCWPVPEPPAPFGGWSKPPGTCFCCGRETSGGNYCYGCGHYVCWSCDAPLEHRPNGLFHNVEDHRRLKVRHAEDHT